MMKGSKHQFPTATCLQQHKRYTGTTVRVHHQLHTSSHTALYEYSDALWQAQALANVGDEAALKGNRRNARPICTHSAYEAREVSR